MTEMQSLLMNGAVLGLVTLMIGILFRIVARDRAHDNASLKDLRDHTTATAKDIYVQLTNFRVEVAKSYVSDSHLKEVEDRIMARLLSLDEKMERLIRNSMKK